MLSEAPASTPNRLSRSGSSAARCLTVDSRRESANLLRRLSCCVRQSLRLPMREMQRSFHSPLRQPCRIAREPATTLQSALTLQSSGTRLSLRSFLTPHFHVGRHGRQQRMDRGDGNRLVSFRCRQQAHRGFHLLQFVFGVGADQSGQRGAQQGNVGLSFPHRVVRTCLYVVGQHLASVRRCVLRVFVPAINACEYSSVHVFLRSCLPPNIPVNGTGGKRRFTNQAASRAGPLPCTLGIGLQQHFGWHANGKRAFRRFQRQVSLSIHYLAVVAGVHAENRRKFSLRQAVLVAPKFQRVGYAHINRLANLRLVQQAQHHCRLRLALVQFGQGGALPNPSLNLTRNSGRLLFVFHALPRAVAVRLALR